MSRLFSFLPILAAIVFIAFPAHAAKDPIYTGTFSNNAVSGYDTVAYFTEGKPVKGSSDFETEYQGATWKFSSAENLELFKADPDKYAPQYGGYCAYAASKGSLASADPEAWTIHDGKLYLNFNKSIREEWKKDIPGNVAKADANYPNLIK